MKRLIPIFLILFFLSFRAFADENPTKSPDGTLTAFTRNNDLWIVDSSGKETRLTFDADADILNGYASWVYYEEIFGRSSKYKAFWWSPDSRRLAFYRFDQKRVPVFPIFSPFSQSGSLKLTRYPKAGQPNPEVRIGIIDLSDPLTVVWADFEESEDQYFGTPFWGSDSNSLYVSRIPRRQSVLELFRVDALSGKKVSVYKEEYATWVDWITGMLFDKDGLYMARSFETGWQQIYFLSYDGKTFKLLTGGRNWNIELLKAANGSVWFLSKKDSPLHPSLYRYDPDGSVTSLTDPGYYARNVRFCDDGTFTVSLSNARTPDFEYTGTAYAKLPRRGGTPLWAKNRPPVSYTSRASAEYDGEPYPEIVKIRNDGYDLYALLTLPRGYDPTVSRRYPVVMQLYGGPGVPYVRDWWHNRDATDRWCWENGIVYMVVDPRTSGENGRAGTDASFRKMTVVEREDYLAWADWIGMQPWADASRIGLEGFSFGGTTTAMLLLRYPERFRCGIAGGGVYDWTLYDSHYTERYMETPDSNSDGYSDASVINFVKSCDSCSLKKQMGLYGRPRLALTHGTGDDNVHYQNTLLLADALQHAGIPFELMLYPDGMHGYRGSQHEFSLDFDHKFWQYHLKDEK